MRLSHAHRFIFFSNPKTGSESIRDLLDPYSDIAGRPFWERTHPLDFYAHIRPIEVRDIFREHGWAFEDYFRFTFVRNPWARILSLYHMIHEVPAGWGPRLHARLTARLPSKRRFRRWVGTISADGEGAGGPPDQRWQRYGSYSLRNFAGDESGRLLVDEVIRLEDVDRALPGLWDRLGLPSLRRPVPHRNVRRYGAYPDWYDDASRERVGELYAEEIEEFGYAFGAE